MLFPYHVLISVGNRMNVSAIADLHYEWVIFKNFLKIARALRREQFENFF